jgi:hypothetical protein
MFAKMDKVEIREKRFLGNVSHRTLKYYEWMLNRWKD